MTNDNEQIKNLRKLCLHYGVPAGDTPQECVKALSGTDRFKTEYAKSHNIEMALERMGVDRQVGITTTAFFVKNDGERYNNDTKQWESVKGVKALMPNGQVFLLEGNNLDAKPIASRLSVGPVDVVENIITGKVNIRTKRETSYRLGGSEDVALPDVGLSGVLEKCFKQSNRGTIWGSSGDNPVLATLAIGVENGDVTHFPEGEFGPETLSVHAFDSDGFGVQVKLDPMDVRKTFYLDEDADRDDYSAVLAGETIVVNGHIGVTFPMEPAKFGGTAEEGERNFSDTIDWLEDMNYLGKYDSNGESIHFLDLSRAPVDEDTGERPTYVRINDKRCMNLQQERDKATGAIVWKASVHHDDVGKLPWMSCKTTIWHDKEGNERHWNPGAFYVFPNRIGASTSNTGKAGVYSGLNDITLEGFDESAPATAADDSVETAPVSY